MILHSRILYEDNHLIAVNKLAGELSQGDETGDVTISDLVKQYIREKYVKPGKVFLGVAHRLDRPVSGVMLFARTSKALERLTEMLRERKIEKTYWAVVKNKPKELSGELVHHLKREKGKNVTKAFQTRQKETKESQL
ncbi:MAG TPA: pseudouridine synthase, partial [Chitinophagales bacterium]|nr:pseudouridine synthase [Chitinophagales bacterium]